MITYSDTQQPVVEVTDTSTAFWDGYDSAIRGAELGEMQTPAAEAGWWEARKHQADTDDYHDWLEESEWFLKGQW
jgi:hypothetical protein